MKVLTLKLCDLLEHCTLLPGEEGELILTAFRQDADSCKFFERIGFEYYHGGKVPKSRLSVHDILVGPGEESALELITIGRPGLPSSPPFSPAESAAVGAATGSKEEYINTELPAKRARQEPGISQRGDESEWF